MRWSCCARALRFSAPQPAGRPGRPASAACWPAPLSYARCASLSSLHRCSESPQRATVWRVVSLHCLADAVQGQQRQLCCGLVGACRDGKGFEQEAACAPEADGGGGSACRHTAESSYVEDNRAAASTRIPGALARRFSLPRRRSPPNPVARGLPSAPFPRLSFAGRAVVAQAASGALSAACLQSMTPVLLWHLQDLRVDEKRPNGAGMRTTGSKGNRQGKRQSFAIFITVCSSSSSRAPAFLGRGLVVLRGDGCWCRCPTWSDLLFCLCLSASSGRLCLGFARFPPGVIVQGCDVLIHMREGRLGAIGLALQQTLDRRLLSWSEALDECTFVLIELAHKRLGDQSGLLGLSS